MDLRIVSQNQKNQYNKLVSHVVQSWEWGEFRQSLGLPLLRYGIYKNGKMTRAFQLTLHKIPFTSQFVGYMPKGPTPDKELSQALEIIGREHNCAYIKVEPNILAGHTPFKVYPTFQLSPKPLFTKHNFLVDLTLSEEELQKNMHQKTRYNIRVAERKGVTVEERTDDKAFKIYLKLYFETTGRQNYLGHNESYHKKVWQTMRDAGMARVLIGFYEPKGSKSNRSSKKKPLTAWMLFNFKDTLYYPYGGSSIEHREVMSNNLVAWEAIKLGKKMGLKHFDMWGAASPDAPPTDPWFGFTDFKRKYGGKMVEYVGTYDLVFNELLYYVFTFFDRNIKLKSFLLKLIAKGQ